MSQSPCHRSDCVIGPRANDDGGQTAHPSAFVRISRGAGGPNGGFPCGMPCPPQAPGRYRGRAAALATASAVMFSTRRTVAAGVRMQAVAATPIRIGPTVTPPLVVVLSTLYRMLAASMFGQISRLAESVSVESAR